MLKGYFSYKGLTVDLNGYDMGGNMYFYMSCPLTETQKQLDRGITVTYEDGDTDYYPPVWDDAYVCIKSGDVEVSCFTRKEGDIIFKNEWNSEFIQKMGSVLRGLKSSCSMQNREDSFEALTGQVEPSKTLSYVIPKFNAKVKLNMGSVIFMSSSMNEFSLKLEEDGSYDLKVNKLTQRNTKFKLDFDGFDFNNLQEDNNLLSDDFGDEDVYSLQEIIERNPDKSYVWLLDRKYEIVNTIERVEEVCKEIWEHDGIVSFDTETTGLNFTFKCFNGEGDRLVGMVFSIREGEAWYFPVAHKKIQNICTPGNEQFIIEKYFKPILENKPLVCHNGAFDWKVMYTYRIFINLVHDTLILMKLTLWNNWRNLSLALKPLTKTFLNRDSFELSDFVKNKWGEGSVTFADLPYESVKFYACPDTDNTLSLLNYALNQHLLEQYGANKVYEIEVAFSLVIAYQEFYGHCANIEKAEQLKKDIDRDVKDLYAKMVELAGHDFNPRSTKDVQKVFFEEMKLPIINYTDSGAPSTGKVFRKALMDRTDENGELLYPIIKYFHEYKTLTQLDSNFIKNLDKHATQDGFLFSSVQQFLETGRVSVNNPNYQSYNDTVKKYIIPRTGYYMLDSDYSSVEYRILSCMAGQQNLIDAFFDPDTDYHTLQASRMFKVPYELVTKQLRSLAKGINFGLPYGMADPSLGEHLYGTKSPENTLKAKKMRAVYFEGQEHVEQFFIKAKADGVKNCYTETHFGRRRYYDKRTTNKGSIERMAGNFRIQGTAADIYKIAMVRLLTEVRRRGWLGKVLISCFVHDECVLEIHKSIDPMIMLKLLKKCMMLELPGWCPLYNGAGFGVNWYNAKKTEIPIQVQDMMCEKWGETGLDIWDGDTDKLYDWEVGLINDYKKNRVIDYLKNEENWGKTLQPVENGFAHEVIEEILAGHNISDVVSKEVHTSKDTVDNLEQFCIAFGLQELFEKADIQRPVYTQDTSTTEIASDDCEYEEDTKSLALSKVKTFGVGLDNANKKVYIDYREDDPQLLDLLYKLIQAHSEGGNYEVLAVKNDEIYTTGLSMKLTGYSPILKAYMTRKNVKGVVK